LVVKLLQDLDLAYSSNWELRPDNHILIIGGETKREENEGAKQTYAFPLVVHSDLLKRHDLVGARLLGHVHLPAGGRGFSESGD
jgi:hypothetical protein